jgi:hypothetical protein
MTHNPFDVTKDTTTLYASDRDVFLFLVDNNVHNRLSVNEVSRIYTRAGHQAASAEDRAVTSRLATLSTALGAAVVVVSTIAVRPAPRLFGTPPKVCRSVFTGCTPMADLLSASLSRSSRLNLWQHSSQIAAICRAAFLKPVLALPRQTVCRDQMAVTVDKIEMGAARSHDRSGRPLPIWQGCHVIADGEVFLMNRRSADSFDGRCFGALPTSAIIGTAEPLWTGEEE